jgi:branched-subunit amino acid transport protein
VNLRLAARLWHGATCMITVFALVAQLVLVVSGASVLMPEDPPSLPERMVRLVGYFTIQANALVAVTTFGLLRNPLRDGPIWRVVRLAAVVGIVVTAIVHWIALRPLLNPTGWSYLCDLLLHVGCRCWP